MTQYLAHPTPTDKVDEELVEQIAGRAHLVADMLALRNELNDQILTQAMTALGVGIKPTRIEAHTGLQRGQIYELRDKRKTPHHSPAPASAPSAAEGADRGVA